MRGEIVRRTTLVSAAALTALAGCGGANSRTEGAPRPTGTTLGLSSSAFLDGSHIPSRYTCDGEDLAPPLTWTRVPARALSLALLVEDRDAPGGDFVHWSVYDLPPRSSGNRRVGLPEGSIEGLNSFGRVGYGGPCPPKGDPAHHYVFSIYALDERPGIAPGASPGSVRQAIAGHAIATGTLTGLYRR
jgi:Raf kinase inhibitor-like YbhB/YbcL family protein